MLKISRDHPLTRGMVRDHTIGEIPDSCIDQSWRRQELRDQKWSNTGRCMRIILVKSFRWIAELVRWCNILGTLSLSTATDGNMAACSFYQNSLRASTVNAWIKMTRNNLMRNFSTTKKLTSCLMPVLQKTSIHFFKRFPTAMHSGKMYIPPSFSLWSIEKMTLTPSQC